MPAASHPDPLEVAVREMRLAVTALELELPHDMWVDVRDRWDRLHVEIAERWRVAE